MKFGMLFVLTIPISVQVVQSLIRYPRISAADRDHSAPPGMTDTPIQHGG
jgi:hypothetical protein